MKKELTLEEIQQESFKVLLKIKEIFDKNGWKYYLTAGTLIGAVRHKGFIPWDDDIDLWIPRSYYEKFIDYCIKNKEKLYPFELIHYKTNPKYIYSIARFSDSRYKIDYKDSKDYGLGLFVDLYPLDGFNKEDKKLERKIRINKSLIGLCGSDKFVKSNNKLKNIFKYFYYIIFKNLNLHKLLEKNDRLAQTYSFENSEIVECVGWSDGRFGYKREWLDNGEELTMEFNKEMFRVPTKYDKVLTRMYGDYMKLPPEDERIAHHYYSAYKK